jgi:hypothetical protein
MISSARCLSIALLCVPVAAVAHHSFAKFDMQQTAEIEGDVVAVRWQNPHVHFVVRGRASDGPIQDWDLETNSPGVLRRMEIDPDIVKVGDHVRVAGNPAVDAGAEMFASNLLLPDGRELRLGSGIPLRFAEEGVGNLNGWRVTEGDKSRPEFGIFRVWSSTSASAPTLFPNRREYPLTESARKAVDAFDRVAESERMAGSCTPKGMPWMMEQPYDLAFEQDGADILLKLEEYDIVRHIHIDWDGDRAEQPYSPAGFSTGEWQDGSLVVTTTNLNSRNFKWEIPASEKAGIVERFTPSELGDRLDYEIVVTDPETFTEPVSISKFWLSIPGQVLDAYNCVSDL